MLDIFNIQCLVIMRKCITFAKKDKNIWQKIIIRY